MMTKKQREKIDFVVLWVDGSDPVWRVEKNKWEKELALTKNDNIDVSDERYRDSGLLRYWFRGVEKFVPWVNKIHFVTYGHLPEWLNVKHPKLHVVKHSDFMPEDALPTFNSNAIELLIHKIDGLSDEFVLFNDDMFILKSLKPTDFFKNGVPCNTMSLVAITPYRKGLFYKTVSNNMEIINKYFEFNKFKSNLSRNLSLRQGKYVLKTAPLLLYRFFPSFANYHVPISYLKSTFDDVWQREGDELMNTVKNKFRNYRDDYNHWLFNYWQFATGNYKQKKYLWGRNLKLTDKCALDYIEKQKYKIVCLNDDSGATEDVFHDIKNAFEKILPEKSQFEVENE